MSTSFSNDLLIREKSTIFLLHLQWFKRYNAYKWYVGSIKASRSTNCSRGREKRRITPLRLTFNFLRIFRIDQCQSLEKYRRWIVFLDSKNRMRPEKIGRRNNLSYRKLIWRRERSVSTVEGGKGQGKRKEGKKMKKKK